MTTKQRYQYVIDYFLEHAPNAETELLYNDPFQLLVAVILSAQCTDKRVNITTPASLTNIQMRKAWLRLSLTIIFPL